MSENRPPVMCPNCKAWGLTEDDHNTGQESPDMWLCDTFVMHEKPNFKVTYDAGKAIQQHLVAAGAERLASIFNT